jgi:hypothetical protein
VQTAIEPDCSINSYQGRVNVKYFAYYNGLQWEKIPLPGNKVSYNFRKNSTVFGDSINRVFYYYEDSYGDYSTPGSLWSFSLDTKQWKRIITALDMRYFSIKDGILYFTSSDSIFTTENGIVRGGGVMKYDGIKLAQLDTSILIDTKQLMVIFIAGDYLYIKKPISKSAQELWRYSLSSKRYEKAPSALYFPGTEYNSLMDYISVGRFIYYNSSQNYPYSRIFRYDTSSGTSAEVPNVKIKSNLGIWQAEEDYIFFLDATIEHKGNVFNGTLLYDIPKDEVIAIKSGYTSTENNPYGLNVLFANHSLYFGGYFYFINGIKADKIARYDLQERKTYTLDGGVYRTDASCHPFSVVSFANIGDKLLVYGDFQSAGIQ